MPYLVPQPSIVESIESRHVQFIENSIRVTGKVLTMERDGIRIAYGSIGLIFQNSYFHRYELTSESFDFHQLP